MSPWKNYDGTCGKLSTMVQTYFKGIYIDTYPPRRLAAGKMGNLQSGDSQVDSISSGA